MHTQVTWLHVGLCWEETAEKWEAGEDYFYRSGAKWGNGENSELAEKEEAELNR